MDLLKKDAGVKFSQSPFGVIMPRFDYEKEQLAEQIREIKIA